MIRKPEAARKQPYKQGDVFRSRHVIDGALSPDASFAIYQLSETVSGKTGDEDAQMNSIWRVELAGGAPRRLTPRGGNATAPQISPDGASVLFLSARDPTGAVTQIHRLPLDGGEAEAVTSLDQGVGAFALSPDGEWIAFAAMERAPTPPGPNDHVRISRFAYRFDPAPGYLQDTAQAIHLMPAKGGKARALTGHDGLVGAMAWSPDSAAIAAIVGGRAARMVSAALGELIVVDRDGKQMVLLDRAAVAGLFWTMDGGKVGYIAPPEADVSRQSQVFLVDRRGGSPAGRSASLDLAVGGAVQGGSPAALATGRPRLTPDREGVIVSVTDGGETGLYEIALSGPESCKPIVSGPRTCKVLDRKGGQLLFSAEDWTTPAELHAVDLATGRERALTSHNADWRSKITWPRTEVIKVMSAPGVEVEGWVLKPPSGEAPFKTLLFIHGGPHAAWGCSFNEDFLEMTGAGYAVAFANPRGSKGYGDAISTAIIGCWGHPELADFTAFLDELVRRGIADPDRLGVTGVSGGGHLSAWLISHTDRFKAAVPEQGVYNMLSMYGVSDAGVDLMTLEMGGPPHEQFQRYWDLSPIAHARACMTPTLLIQGENDIRCPMEQAEQFYTVLKHNGCEVELLRLKNCNHGRQIFGPPALRRFRMDAMRDWFDRHVA